MELAVVRELSIDLQSMLSGLAHQDAGEFLPIHEKMKTLGYGVENQEKPLAVARKVARRPATKRIALISDGKGFSAPLRYAIDACLRQDAKIDLLVHGAIEVVGITALETQAQHAGIRCQRIPLGINAVGDIVEYVGNHPSLIFLVATPHDAVARELIEEVVPKRRGRIPVPMVLIEKQIAA